jgi:alkaline phosphatase
MFSRKDFLKSGAMSAFMAPAALATLGGTRRPSAAVAGSRDGSARNVIFLVADGMSIGALTMGDLMSRRQYGKASAWIDLYSGGRDVFRGLMDMASADSFVTDSSAAASSWGCGHRINNGGVNWSVEGEPLRPITHIFRDAGKATGLVTTTRITHATPAGFAANAPSRNLEAEIAVQYLENRIDVLMGGGDSYFSASNRKDGRDLYAEFAAAGYAIARTRADLEGSGATAPFLGIFHASHLPYTVDHRTVPQLRDEVPTLAEMTRAALRKLDRHPDGFILQIEGGRVDHAAHSNDPAGLVYDMVAFNDAIEAVIEYVDGRDDTLVIITTDHSNANVGVNGSGPGYTNAPKMFDQLQGFRHSNEWIFEQLPKEPMPAQIQEVVAAATRLQITTQEAEMLAQSMKGTFVTPYREERVPSAVLGAIQANYLSINWLGGVHTSDYVELAALGPGSERLSYFTRNTELFDLMVDMAGVRSFAKSA